MGGPKVSGGLSAEEMSRIRMEEREFQEKMRQQRMDEESARDKRRREMDAAEALRLKREEAARRQAIIDKSQKSVTDAADVGDHDEGEQNLTLDFYGAIGQGSGKIVKPE